MEAFGDDQVTGQAFRLNRLLRAEIVEMAPSKSPKTAAKTAGGKVASAKKEKVYHPESRKASQLARKALRKGKLGNLAQKRGKKHNDLRALILHSPLDYVLNI